MIAGRRVAVTGTGSPLGAELKRQVRALGPSSLRVFKDDVRDPQAVDEFFHAARAEVVLHAATFTHRRLSERRPSEAVKTNIQGTDHVVRAAVKGGARRVVLLSSELAADPAGSMAGASLRVAELVVERAAARARKKDGSAAPVLAVVRVGQVVDAGPEGSLPDLLAVQLKAGGPVTLSSPDATRSLLTAQEAVARVLAAAEAATGGGIYAVDMGEPVRVVDLVARLAREQGLSEVPIRYTDPRRGHPSQGVTRPGYVVATGTSHVFSIQGCEDPAKLAELPERLQKLYASARKNRDPKVRQQVLKLSRT